MGDDAALACLSDRPRMLYHYFKQKFAQVSNPAMDSINERPVMALHSTFGAEKQPARRDGIEHARMIRDRAPGPHQRGAREAARIEAPGFESHPACLFKVADGGRRALRAALDRLCAEAEARRLARAVNILILSDRERRPISRRSRCCSPPVPCTTT